MGMQPVFIKQIGSERADIRMQSPRTPEGCTATSTQGAVKAAIPGGHAMSCYMTWREIVALYRLTVPATPERNLPARYNICPTNMIDVVIERDAKRELVPMRWGLVPSWWKKKAKETPATFNARAETVAEKPMFRSAFKRSRCLIPASGYYEWLNTLTGKKAALLLHGAQRLTADNRRTME
jgi:hypothetical protein